MSKYITDKRFFMILFLLILLVILVFIGIIYWPAVQYELHKNVTPQFTPTITPTPTKLPTSFPNVARDYFEYHNMTDGLLVGSGFLVLIILLGVLISIRNNEK